jgi:segregation and condensation protein B
MTPEDTPTLTGQRLALRPAQAGLQLLARVEALLFVADEPVAIHQLAQALDVSEGDILAALETLAQHYRVRGLRLQRSDRSVQFVTAPEAAADVQRFLGLESTSKLSPAAMETLALVAYQQPITRVQVEAVRGVNCDGVLRTLLSRGLVAAQGRLEQVGRPIVYGTTFEFLQYFGLSDLSQLPAWHSLEGSERQGFGSGDGRSWNEPGRKADEAHSDEQVRDR